jgi:hypothetical protein
MQQHVHVCGVWVGQGQPSPAHCLAEGVRRAYVAPSCPLVLQPFAEHWPDGYHNVDRCTLLYCLLV